MNRKIKIGAFSKLCRVTVKTLRHYEELGLLIPAAIDEWTGYRYYEASQFQRMGLIVHLKRAGLSLNEISEIVEQGNNRPTLDMIQQKIHACEIEIERLLGRLKELRSLEEQLLNYQQMETFTIKTIPARLVASHREILKSYDDLGARCVNVIGPEMMRVGCTCPEPQYCYTIEHDKEHKEQDIDVEYCEAIGEMHEDTPLLRFYEAPAIERALCYPHRGSYTTFSESMIKVMQYIEEHQMRIVGDPRFCYIDGPWNKEHEADWLTEIQVPIE